MKTVLTAALVLSCGFLAAQTITFSEQVAPIIYNKCSSCHHAGGIGPMTFTSYEEVKRYAGMIHMAAIEDKFMPPWMPDSSFSHFTDERLITAAEVETLKKWIDAGMPRGNKAAEPDLPMYSKGGMLGRPDLTLSMKESFTHCGGNKDEYRIFVLPTNLTEGHNVSAIEIKPGNPRIAHHIILGLDTTSTADKLDEKDPAYGYAQYTGFGFYPTYDNWSGWVPGNKSRFFPTGIGNYILPHSKVLLQMHYGPSPQPANDSTTVNIYYSDKPVSRFIRTQVITPNDIKDGPFFIPAGKIKTFHAEYKIVSDISLISITPHSHWLGKKWEVFAKTPAGDTIPLIRINDWDFNWQNFFSFKKFIRLEKGTILYANATFDNSESNFRNPNKPLKNVMWGESAKDEMFLCYFAYVPYQVGDENIDIAGKVNGFAADVDKSSKRISVQYSLAEAGAVQIRITDGAGMTVKTIVSAENTEAGSHDSQTGLNDLKPGIYWCKMITPTYTESRKLIIE